MDVNIAFTIPLDSPLFIGAAIVLGVILYLLIGSFVSAWLFVFPTKPDSGESAFTIVVWPVILILYCVYYTVHGIMYPFVALQNRLLSSKKE